MGDLNRASDRGLTCQDNDRPQISWTDSPLPHRIVETCGFRLLSSRSAPLRKCDIQRLIHPICRRKIWTIAPWKNANSEAPNEDDIFSQAILPELIGEATQYTGQRIGPCSEDVDGQTQGTTYLRSEFSHVCASRLARSREPSTLRSDCARESCALIVSLTTCTSVCILLSTSWGGANAEQDLRPHSDERM